MSMFFDIEEMHGLLIPKNDNTACVHIRRTGRLDWDDQFNSLKVWQELRPGMVVLDAGAFIGDTTKIFLDRQCEVHAFEPRPETFVCLLHNCPGAHCYNLALGDGTRFETATTGGNMGGKPLLPGRRYSIRLDDLRMERLDLLKLDVEGFEVRALQGAINTICRLHPMIHVEFNTVGLAQCGATPKMLEESLRSLGYGNLEEVYRYSDSQWDIFCRHLR